MNSPGLLLFDIDGVIRDVASSYRRAIQESVNYFCNWKPSIKEIDSLKNEGCWNNDWDASLELIKRYKKESGKSEGIPHKKSLIQIFNDFYFGGDPNGKSSKWNGFIQNEPLLVNKELFKNLSLQGINWGFVSGAERVSAEFVLEERLGLKNPPLIAMGEAPDKPDPTGFIRLAKQITKKELGKSLPPICYIGDTVADILTIKNAKLLIPDQKFISIGIAPPHLHRKENKFERLEYEKKLYQAGADQIIKLTIDLETKGIQFLNESQKNCYK